MLGDAEGSTVQDKCQKKNKNTKGRSAEPMILSDLETNVATGKLQLLMLLNYWCTVPGFQLDLQLTWLITGIPNMAAHHFGKGSTGGF